MRAKGLCGTHYNQTLPQRHKKRQVSCAACGKSLAKVSSGDRRPVCSYRCRSFLQYGRWPDEKPPKPPMELVGPVPRLPRSAFWPDRSTELPRVARVFTQGSCDWCGETFTRVVVGTTPAGHCSPYCGRRAAKARSRLRNGRFEISRRRRLAIYERDNWTCQLCFESVDPDLPSTDIWSATLDHIIPQSHMLIPDHSDKNLRLSHLWCNAVRGDETYYTAADLAA